jgi:hypothetical protein
MWNASDWLFGVKTALNEVAASCEFCIQASRELDSMKRRADVRVSRAKLTRPLRAIAFEVI